MSALERLAAVTSQHQQNMASRASDAKKAAKPKPYQWRPQSEEANTKEAVTTPTEIKEALNMRKPRN